MKIFGDVKTKKTTKRLALGMIAVLLAVIAVVFLLQTKPFESRLESTGISGENPADSLGATPVGTGGDRVPELTYKQVGLEDLTKYDADRKQDYYTILIAGTDNDGIRTDTIMIAAFDVKAKTVSVMSIPRDTLVNVTRSVKKVNSAYAVGGVKELKAELKGLLGFQVDRYAIVGIQGMAELIDAIDGVYVDVPVDMDYDDPSQDLDINIKAGYQLLDGENAVDFARYRSGYANADIGRIAAQQRLVSAVVKKLISPSTIPKIPSLVSIVMKNVESDFTIGEMISLSVAGLSVDPETIEMFTLPGYDETLRGQSYWVPYENQLLKIINSNFNPSEKKISSLNLMNASSMRPKEPDPEPTKPDPEPTKPEAGTTQEGGSSESGLEAQLPSERQSFERPSWPSITP